ncbi:MAG: DUF1800 domain-containing protein [Thermoanaerobaculia bacterium]
MYRPSLPTQPCQGFLAALLLLSALSAGAQREPLPWRQAGLTERQAAAHLLNRFTYGPRPGDVERVLEVGLRNWVEGQLHGDSSGVEVAAKLAPFATISMDDEEILRRFPLHSMSMSEAIESAGVDLADYSGERGHDRSRAARTAVTEFLVEKGYLAPGRILEELGGQKLYRALYGDSQLIEVLTDFWFNHFNVSATATAIQPYVPSFERAAIRSHVLGSFRTLLAATAKHPAMLAYLDNHRSQAEPGTTTTFDVTMTGFDSFSPTGNPTSRAALLRSLGWRPESFTNAARTSAGLNENYARELMELHTLGADGGYDQRDVIEVARAFTGWTYFPHRGARAGQIRRVFQAASEEPELGFVAEGQFLFRADLHDAEPKTILGVPFPGGRGIEDGEEVLDLLAAHPATARRVARKIAVRFVSESPPQKLVARLARTFDLTGGDLRELVRTLVDSPEFWQEESRFNKLKSPFELVVSTLRALDAEVTDHWALNRWTFFAGQPLYVYSAPTGYPDRERTWLSTGSLLVRINFAQVIARDRIAGVTIDLLRLIDRKEPRSVAEAIDVYAPLILPGRPLGELLTEVAAAAPEPPVRLPKTAAAQRHAEIAARQRALQHAKNAVAILLASPEFQRR